MAIRVCHTLLTGIAALALILFSTISWANARQKAGKLYTFRGRVEQVDAAAKHLTVNSEPVEGWMGAMTMAFKVSNEDVLDRLKPGDQITAKVYDGDLTLYDVTLVPQASATPVPNRPQRASLRLEDLERVALVNNPTVAQLQANLRVASGLARQAGLYPNPSVGYYGDEIRGGYSGGANKVAL